MADVLAPPRIDLLVHTPSAEPLHPILTTLLEPSAPLTKLLIPQLYLSLERRRSTAPATLPKTYKELFAIAAELVQQWDVRDQAEFLSAHPRIGETKQLSALSGKEQGGQTPGEVLKRLSALNSIYEECFPGLRYTTFVNGRTRAEIVPEMEELLNLRLPPPSPSTPEPTLTVLRQRVTIRPMGSQLYRAELARGLEAMWNIALNRLQGWGVN